MGDFKPIETQEELNNIIKDRLDRQQKTIESSIMEKYADYDDLKEANSNLQSKLEELQKESEINKKTIADLNSKVQTHETNSAKMRIAQEYNIPYELSSRLNGDDEESIRKDAQMLSKLVSKNNKVEIIPLASTEPSTVDIKKSALKKTLQDVKGE